MVGGKTERLSGEMGIQRAAELLRAGGTVAFPTETVYGLGANALDTEAVAKIFAAKQRPAWDPVIVHISGREMLQAIAVVSLRAESLINAFWPGPLTLLLPRTAAVPDSVTAGRELVGVRMPKHPLALNLIRTASLPVAAPSANLFGRTSPTTAAHVLTDLDGRIDAVLDGGATSVGVESTVLDVGKCIIYRPGAITAEMIAKIVGDVSIFQPQAGDLSSTPESLPSPGVGLRHYAPRAELILIDVPAGGDLMRTLSEAMKTHDVATVSTGCMVPEGWDASNATQVFSWGPWGDFETLARRLFAGLRMLDDAGASVIFCPLPPAEGVGVALRDRLQKAARKK